MPMISPQRADELISTYADGPRLIEDSLAGIPDDELFYKPGPEHWSIFENVAHLADIDLIVAARIRFVLAVPGMPMLATDAAGWARAIDYSAWTLEDCLALMRAARGSTAALLRRAPAEAWANTGVHSAHGPQTLEWIVGQMVKHAEAHLQTIAKRRRQYAEARAG